MCECGAHVAHRDIQRRGIFRRNAKTCRPAVFKYDSKTSLPKAEYCGTLSYKMREMVKDAVKRPGRNGLVGLPSPHDALFLGFGHVRLLFGLCRAVRRLRRSQLLLLLLLLLLLPKLPLAISFELFDVGLGESDGGGGAPEHGGVLERVAGQRSVVSVRTGAAVGTKE